MGFRRLLKRAVKPAAMVGVVGMLSLSLIVTTPSNAQALVTYPKIPPAATFVMGATKTVAPVAMAAASFTPVGLGLKLAFLAFSTADLWVPLVTGAFGNPKTAEEAPKTEGYFILTGFRLSSQGFQAPNRMLYGWTFTTGTTIAKTATISTVYKCRQTATGNASRPVGTIFDNNATFTIGGLTNQTTSGTTAAGRVCPDGSEVVGGSAGPSKSSTAQNGPENVLYYGDTGTAFDSRGSDVGYQGRSECIDAQGTVSWAEGPITPGDNDGGTMLMPSCEKAGKGHGTGRTQVKGFKPDGTTETVWDTGANPLSDPATPLCDPGRTSSGCLMEVTKDGQPCKSGDVECENWASESKKEGNTRYGCKLGPYMLPASACSLLEQAYMPGGSPLNDQNTDGDPATRSNAGPNGQPAPAPAPVTNGTPGTSPVPGGAGAPAAGADVDSSACWPTGWGMLNPLEWVYKPVVCASKALFEPKKDVQTRINGMSAAFSDKIPVSWFGVGVEGVSGGACPTNWAVELNGHSYSLICGSAADGIIRGFRPVLGGMLVMAMLWPLIRSLFYSAIPVFKVTPS